MIRQMRSFALVAMLLLCAQSAMAQKCTGDCNGDGEVRVNEVITCVNIGLETTPLAQCAACDTNDDGLVTINEIITAVNIGLGLLRPPACDGTVATATPTSGVDTPTPPAATPTATQAVDTPTAPAGTPTPTMPFGVCADCHPEKAASLLEFGHGDANFVCESCHVESLGPPGPGHRSIPLCTSCHAKQMTHEPAEAAVGGEQQCVVCHTPHGSPNLYLVKPIIMVPGGQLRDVVFDNEMGKADGSFASASAPGTGVCEICHGTTEFYNNTGTGESHFTFTCTGCHTHVRGFEPPQ